MNEIPSYICWLTRTTFVFLAFCFLAVALLPEYRSIFFGIIVGSMVSFVNTKYLARKVQKMTDEAASGTGKRFKGLGFAQRAAISIGGVILAIEFPHLFEIHSLAGSLVFAPFALIIIGFFLSRHESKLNSANERGEKNA
ncbi:ATP synthase subunit I [Paenibacillus sp. Z6-24]